MKCGHPASELDRAEEFRLGGIDRLPAHQRQEGQEGHRGVLRTGAGGPDAAERNACLAFEGRGNPRDHLAQ